jgi:hypothetical protein
MRELEKIKKERLAQKEKEVWSPGSNLKIVTYDLRNASVRLKRRSNESTISREATLCSIRQN